MALFLVKYFTGLLKTASVLLLTLGTGAIALGGTLTQLDPERWMTMPPLPAVRYSHGAIAVNGSLLAAGGRDRFGKIQKTVYRAPLHGNATYSFWKRETDLPGGLANFALGASGSCLYLSGGMRVAAKGEEISGDIWIATLGNDGSPRNWRRTEPLSEPLYAHCQVFYKNRIYILGGMAADGMRSDVNMAEIAQDGRVGSWNVTTSFPAPMAYSAAVVVGDYVIVVGGQSPTEGKTLIMPTAYVGPFAKDGGIQTWYLATSKLPGAWLGYGRNQTALTVWQNTLYAFGGQDASWFFINNVASAVFDPDKGELGSWGVSEGPKDMPQVTALAVWKDAVYLVGGMVQGKASEKVLSGRFSAVAAEDSP